VGDGGIYCGGSREVRSGLEMHNIPGGEEKCWKSLFLRVLTSNKGISPDAPRNLLLPSVKDTI